MNPPNRLVILIIGIFIVVALVFAIVTHDTHRTIKSHVPAPQKDTSALGKIKQFYYARTPHREDVHTCLLAIYRNDLFESIHDHVAKGETMLELMHHSPELRLICFDEQGERATHIIKPRHIGIREVHYRMVNGILIADAIMPDGSSSPMIIATTELVEKENQKRQQ